MIDLAIAFSSSFELGVLSIPFSLIVIGLQCDHEYAFYSGGELLAMVSISEGLECLVAFR